MVATKKVEIPSDEDLSVQDVNLSVSSLRAGAFQMGKMCEQENNEFMLCKKELQDPRKCLDEGKMVTKCALTFFQNVKKFCHQELTDYAFCLNNSSGDMRFEYCRNTQHVFDRCVMENLGVERPDYGYFCRIKVSSYPSPSFCRIQTGFGS